MQQEIRCVVSGKVQNVGYRYFVQACAKELELVGTVANLPDGSVEVVAQGTTDELKELIRQLHEGSVLAKVDGVAVDWRSSKRNFDDFTAVYSNNGTT